MTLLLYTEADLARLQSMPKRVTKRGARWSEKPKSAPVHKQRNFQAVSEHEADTRFAIYQRQNLNDRIDFSCGIACHLPNGSLLTLARYNGPSHPHGDIAWRPHIHRATEEAIAAGKKPESEATETNRYETLEGALACLIDDFRVSGIAAKPDDPVLFPP